MHATSTTTVFDFIVIGSGSAGLMAALTAADMGLSTIVLEKSAFIGGTSALSGGGLWIPANSIARRAGIYDSVAEASAYVRATSPDGWQDVEEKRWTAFCENGHRALDHLCANTPITFDIVPLADIYPYAAGAKQLGRVLSPQLLDLRCAGTLASKIRKPKFPHLFTFSEVLDGRPFNQQRSNQLCDLMLAAFRYTTRKRAMGTALVAGMVSGLARKNVLIETEVTAKELLRDGDRVTGVRALIHGKSTEMKARKGVLIATGGFEWDQVLMDRHFPGPRDFIASPRTNQGDGHRMAEAVGAELDRMDQANMHFLLPGKYEGSIQGIGWFFSKMDNAIVVSKDGLRFGDETHANFSLALDKRAANNLPVHLPAWLITDGAFLKRERLPLLIARHAKGWIRRAGTLDALATEIGISPVTLEDTVEEFNRSIQAQKQDPMGREDRSEIKVRPFVAIPFNRSFISTKGGPRTDENGVVLRSDGTEITGLYCAGVAMASPFGTKAIGGCTTLGPNITWGYLAAKHAARA